MKKFVLAVTALTVMFCVGCGGKGDTRETRASDVADTLTADTAVVAAASLEIISKDYKYEKSGAEYYVHLENIGNSDKIYNLINKLIYKGKNFGEYMEYTEKNFIDGYNEIEGFELEENYSIICNNDTNMIFEYSSNTYTGGAHNYYMTKYFIIDLIEERKIDINELVRPMPNNLLDEIIKSTLDDIDDGLYFRENIWPPDAINFCGKNMELLWNPYTIASFAVGEIRIEIQDSVIARYLTDKGKSLRTKPMVNRPKTSAVP